MSAYITGFLFRILIGEPSLGIPQVISFGPYIPPKTLCMTICLATTLIVSQIAKSLFERRILSPSWDIFHCLVDIPSEILPLKESTTTDELHYKGILKTTATGQQYLADPTLMLNPSFSQSHETISTYQQD